MTESGSNSPALIRRTRRVQDMIMAAVHRACDEGQLELAGRLLVLGEEAIAGQSDAKRRRQDLWGLIAAHERLWHLRHGQSGTDAAQHTHLSVTSGFGLAPGGG